MAEEYAHHNDTGEIIILTTPSHTRYRGPVDVTWYRKLDSNIVYSTPTIKYNQQFTEGLPAMMDFRKYGHRAFLKTNSPFELTVVKDGGKWRIGTKFLTKMYTVESAEEYESQYDARAALTSNNWTQR